MECHPQETVLFLCGSLSQAAVLHDLPQPESLPKGAVLQEQHVPALVPHRVTGPASKRAPGWAPVSVHPQVLPGACSNLSLLQGHSCFQSSRCSTVGAFMGCKWIPAPAWTHPSTQVHTGVTAWPAQKLQHRKLQQHPGHLPALALCHGCFQNALGPSTVRRSAAQHWGKQQRQQVATNEH